MVEAGGTTPVPVNVETGVFSGVVCGVVSEVVIGAVPVATEVVLTIGKGLVSTDVETDGILRTGVELGTGGLEEAGPQLKPTLWTPISQLSFLSVSGSFTVTVLAPPHCVFLMIEPPLEQETGCLQT